MADQEYQRKLTAILSADVAGYSMLMRDDEAATVRTITTYRKVLAQLIQQYRGRMVDSPGDNILAEFTSVVDAVNCAVEIQRELAERNAEMPENRKMKFRIGINLGDVIAEGKRIYGDGVNIAARLEGLADVGGICISGTVYDAIESKIGLEYEFLGEQEVKNIDKLIRAYRVLSYPGAAAYRVVKAKKAVGKKWRKMTMAAVVVVIVVAGIGPVVWNQYFGPPVLEKASVEKMAFPLPDKPSIALLPFNNMSGDPNQEYLCDGISEAIISTLSKVPGLFVIARNSSFTYKGKPVKVQRVAEELGVRYVLEGSVQRSNDILRVTAQLIDALKGNHLWSERYDFNMDDLLSIQDEIAMSVLVETQVKLTEGEQVRLLKKETNNLKAYEKFMQATSYYRRTNRMDMYKARQLYEDAIRLDPDFSGAYRMVAATHMWDFTRKWSKDSDRSWQMTIEYAEKALALDENNPGNLLLWSAINQYRGNYEKSIELCQRFVELNPNDTGALESLAGRLFNAGRYEEAIPFQEQAGRLNPFPPGRYHRNSGLYYWFVGQYEKAILASKKALQINPDDITAFRNLAAIYVELGRNEQAGLAAENVMRLEPNFSIESHFKNMPWKDREGMARYMDALRKAGLPDFQHSIEPEKPTIAVLPFENMSGDPDQQYFSDGITEQIITSISKVPYISVIARQSSFAFRNSEKTVQQIAEELGVKYILEGSLQRSGDQLRINAQLIDAVSGHHIWAENYDREFNDIFAVQDEICKNIMVALQVKLTLGESARMDVAKVNINAYQKNLEALEHYRRRIKDEVPVAQQLAREAIAIDPEYASAYILIGWTYLDEVWFGITKTPSISIAKAEEMVQKAISIRGITAEENGLLSSIHLLKKDLDKAIFYAQEAINEYPSSAPSHHILGMALRSNGQYHEAIACFKRALKLNPIKTINYLNNLAWAYLYSKQYEKAISTWNDTLDRHPDYLFAYMGLTCAYWLTGSKDRAKEAAKQVLRINPKFSVGYWEKRSYLKDRKLRDQLFDAWRKAGLQ